MDWQQKFKAIKALSLDVSLKMRDAGDWYVSAYGINRREGIMLCGGLTSSDSPEGAVNQYWDWMTDPPSSEYYIVRSDYRGRRAFRWARFMWQDVEEKLADA
jgi:hypothetical protein